MVRHLHMSDERKVRRATSRGHSEALAAHYFDAHCFDIAQPSASTLQHFRQLPSVH